MLFEKLKDVKEKSSTTQKPKTSNFKKIIRLNKIFSRHNKVTWPQTFTNLSTEYQLLHFKHSKGSHHSVPQNEPPVEKWAKHVNKQSVKEAIKKEEEEILPLAATWMDMETVILNEVNRQILYDTTYT